MTAQCRDCGSMLHDIVIIMSPSVLDAAGICPGCGEEKMALAGSWRLEDLYLPEEEYEGQLLLPLG